MLHMNNDDDHIPGNEEDPLAFFCGVLWACAIMAFVVLVLCATYSIARAHNAPSGWTYSMECCSNADCFPLEDGAVRDVPEGYSVPLDPTGTRREVIPFGDHRIHPSGDGHFHVCIPYRSVRCLYVPARGV